MKTARQHFHKRDLPHMFPPVDNAAQFVAAMEGIWKGGEWYGAWHHARKVAICAGATRTGGGMKGDLDGSYDIYEWPDGSRARIQTNGAGVQLVD